MNRWRYAVATCGAIAWIAMPVLSLTANLEYHSRGQLTRGDPTAYLAFTFVLGIVLGAVVVSPYIGFLFLIRTRSTSYAVGILLIALTAYCFVAWQMSDDGQAGLALFQLPLAGWPVVGAAALFEARRRAQR